MRAVGRIDPGGHRAGGRAIPGSANDVSGNEAALAPIAAAPVLDIARLEAAVDALADRFVALRDENAKLAAEIAARDARIEELEAESRRHQQTRRDVAQRIDELIRQIDQLEGRFPARSE